MSRCKFRLVLLGLCTISLSAFAIQQDTFRNVIIYPYHAAPYYSYPYTTGYGYHYSIPIVNAEYHHPHNDRQIVSYPDGPYHFHNYYKIGNTVCYQVAHRVVCSF